MSTIGETPIDLSITPIDGRNFYKVNALSKYFSERALNSARITVEVEYLLWLSKFHIIRAITAKEKQFLSTFPSLTTIDYLRIRDIEKQTNHDVKALELFLQKKLASTSLRDVQQYIHFGLTSEDINSTSYALMIHGAMQDVFLPILKTIYKTIKRQAKHYASIPMLARTHGQPANGTTYGKELAVFAYRLHARVRELQAIRIAGKISGNVGNFAAQSSAFPAVRWLKFSKTFLQHLHIPEAPLSTQITPYDSFIQLFQQLQHINVILLGLAKDLWLYAAFGLLTQKHISAEVGSTALPHKINPIYLEGAEGGLDVANSLLEGYIRKLSYSRLQRDLSDSTVKRSFGIMFSYCLLSYQSILEALTRIEPNAKAMRDELMAHPEILSEAIQTILRVEGVPDAYELAKRFFRGNVHTQEEIAQFIRTLPISQSKKAYLSSLVPTTYIGLAEQLVQTYV